MTQHTPSPAECALFAFNVLCRRCVARQCHAETMRATEYQPVYECERSRSTRCTTRPGGEGGGGGEASPFGAADAAGIWRPACAAVGIRGRRNPCQRGLLLLLHLVGVEDLLLATVEQRLSLFHQAVGLRLHRCARKRTLREMLLESDRQALGY